MKKLINIAAFLFLIVQVNAQSEVHFTHFIFNKMNYNPAYTGNQGVFDAVALYRNQWAAIDGAPTNIYAGIQFPFKKDRNALGFGLTTDKIGKVDNTSLDISYAYHIPFNNRNRLSIGISGRIEQAKIDWSKATPLDLIDVNIPANQETSTAPNFGVGAYYSGNNFFVGLSVPQLMKNALFLDRSGRSDDAFFRHTYLMGGLTTQLTSQIDFAPSFLVSYRANAPVDLDLNANFIFLDMFWAGLSYRLGDSIDGMVGYQFKNGFRVGFAVDYTTSALDKLTSGSFEIMAGYTFKCQECSVTNLRFF
jgi:type IX secretion system PorP/SprF family membrane protein